MNDTNGCKNKLTNDFQIHFNTNFKNKIIENQI